jgi:RNA polymerase sigma factor (sigma-70 family)
MSEDQKELILQCVRGERKAQFQLYKLYSRQMFSICMRMLSQRDEAEDALQDAFVAAFKSIEQFKHESTFGAWLKRIVVNKCINAANRKNRSMWISIDNDSMDIAEDAAEEPLSIEPEQLNDAVKNLPEGCRMVFTLYAFENYPHAEVAQMLNISVGTSKSQYNRAKSLLKQELKKLQPCETK